MLEGGQPISIISYDTLQILIDLPILYSTVIYGTINTRKSYTGAVCQW